MGNEKYLYHEDGLVSAIDAGGWVIEYVAPPDRDGAPSDSKYAALHPIFLYAPSSVPDDYVPPPRVVEFYAPW